MESGSLRRIEWKREAVIEELGSLYWVLRFWKVGRGVFRLRVRRIVG